MSDETTKPEGPDFHQGVALSLVPAQGSVVGHVQGEPALLVRRGDALFAVGAFCTHYGAPLSDGLIVGDTIRCPWHHACFSLRTGQALCAPALDSIPGWRVEQRDGMVYARERLESGPGAKAPAAGGAPESVVIVGGGAAGNAAAETLRNEGYAGRITMLSADDAAPYDRPNLSKGYLAGSAPEEFIPLRTAQFYRERDIALKLGARVVSIDVKNKSVALADGDSYRYDALLLATGAQPIKLDLPGADLPCVHYLRSLADCKALIAAAGAASQAVVVGASFIGLEVAAALRARHIDVDVVAPETIPMERILGADAGRFIRGLHEEHGVRFHLGTTVAAITPQSVVLKDGTALDADLVVVGVGVRPDTGLAEKAGLAVDRGVVVDEYLQTGVQGIFAVGDIARWPDRRSGESLRVEHWAVAERQGQTAARNILGRRERFDAVPFFWTEQYDLTISYVGHAAQWDEARIEGRINERDCAISYLRQGKVCAVATIGRDQQSLEAEARMQDDAVDA